MSLVRVVFDLRRRRVVSALDASPPDWIPQNWINHPFEFSFQARAGLQENPGQVFVESATARHLLVTAPYADPVVVDTTPMTAGSHEVVGTGSPLDSIYFAEGEEGDTVGRWAGVPSSGTVVV